MTIPQFTYVCVIICRANHTSYLWDHSSENYFSSIVIQQAWKDPIMATVAPQSERRTSFSPNDRKASASLREMPSYKAEASRALNRQEDLKSLSKRLSSNRDLLNADPSTKPWLKFRSISRTENLAKVREDAGQAFPVQEDGTYTATPATVTPANTPTTLPENSWRSRNISSDQSSENNSLNESYEYWIKVQILFGHPVVSKRGCNNLQGGARCQKFKHERL